MEYASILTLMRADQDNSVLNTALDYARDAHLIVMVVAESPPVPVSAYDMLNGEIWTMEVERARKLAKERAEEVEKLLSERGQRGQVLAHVAGPEGLSSLIASTARYADLVVLCADQDPQARMQHAIVTGGLYESGAPVILSPRGKPLPEKLGTVIVAWNATPEVSRAVKQALPLLKSAAKVKAVLVDPVPTPYGHGEEPGANIAAFLGHHDIKVDVVPVPSEGHSVEEVLVQQARTEGADLLVMGAYGHSRLRERIFGGTTRAILEDPPCAVFMAH